uniref:GTP-binding protein Rheb isoform 1 n=1 Tax=Diplonema ambulator TaxID=182243 RepID=A0A2R4IKT5_9EUGL|nr:GTP-binding protein Rheb isoform 1 [Diplonema ambulator]|eukprot:TRINITY_DN2028_c1_g2_i1.p1 TRINITY_DN2028_c1_g2~~TRINITY_DN2028_c1_g2_i1.p1  ORF type:complete len:272 (+),score=82.53 TRINITY_DN2028_c1_g2_i1:75-890(+)
MSDEAGSNGASTHRPRWRPDSEVTNCEECKADFSFFNRRHHCRNCGGVFCNKCSNEKRVLGAEMGYGGESQRVCKTCAKQLDKGAAVAPHIAEKKEPVIKQRKICVLGKSWVGKSAICVQFVEDRFSPYYNPTINHTYQKKIRHGNNQYLLSILDTAGQDECSMFQPQYSIGTHGYIILYSINDYHSFEMVKSIYDRIQDCNILDGVVLVLVGNKSDLPASERQVSYEEGQQLAQSWGFPFMECSAKNAENIERVFNLVLEEILNAEGEGS